MSRKPIINSTQLYVRIVILVLALGGSLYSIREVKNNKTLDAFFGRHPEQDTQITSGVLNLCPTRVLQIDVRDNRSNAHLSYHQKESKWVVEADQKFELDPLFMEKWLGEFCEVKIDKFIEIPAGAIPALAVAQDIRFTYIDGSSQELVVHGEEFTTSKGLVMSEELTRAISKLNP